MLALLRLTAAAFVAVLAIFSPTVNAGMSPVEVGAFECFKENAGKGDAIAQFRLGICYDYGEGVAKNQMEAVKWFRKSAEQGYAEAQHVLGCCYATGQGAAKEEVEAARWFRRAAEQGHARAQNDLGLCYYNGRGVKKDQVEAVAWYREAAEQGDATAQRNLGFCYAIGSGVAKEEVEAYAYLNLSGITDELARKALAVLEKNMSPDARFLGQQRTKQLQKAIEDRSDTAEGIRKSLDRRERSKGA